MDGQVTPNVIKRPGLESYHADVRVDYSTEIGTFYRLEVHKRVGIS